MRKIWNFISSASHSRTTAVLVILILFASVPLTVFVAQQQQQTQQHASDAALPDNLWNALNNQAQGHPSQADLDTINAAKASPPVGTVGYDANHPGANTLGAYIPPQDKGLSVPIDQLPVPIIPNPLAPSYEAPQVPAATIAPSPTATVAPTCQGSPETFVCNNKCYGVIHCPGGWQCDLAKDAPICPSLIGPTPTPVAQCIARYVSAYCNSTGSCQWAPLIAKPECSSAIVNYFLCFGNSQSTAQTMAQTICNAPAVTAAPAITANQTVATGNVALNLVIGLDGIGSTGDKVSPATKPTFTNPDASKQTIQAFIHISDNKQDVTKIPVSLTYNSASGKYQGTGNIPTTITGTHDIRIEVAGHAIKKVGVTTGAPQTLSGNLFAGDINGDGTIDVLDYQILIGCWFPTKNNGQATCGAHQQDADLNGDGKVDQIDYNLFLREFGQSGD